MMEDSRNERDRENEMSQAKGKELRAVSGGHVPT